MKDKRIINSYFAFRKYILFFLSTAFVVTACLMIFTNTIQDTLGHKFTDAEISRAAIRTFINVFVVSAVLTASDWLLSLYRIKKPVNDILSFTDELASGHFGIGLPEKGGLRAGEFDIIIHNLNRLSKELDGMASLRSDFVANVSHEIKTPIAVIQSYAQLLELEDITEEKRREYTAAILASSRRLSGMVSDILRLNKLEKQEIFKTDTSFSLSDELAECLLSFESRWEEKDIILDADIDEDVFITSDRELLDIVWNNLISNAIKFTDKGGTVSVSLKKEDGKCTVRVRDTGCGIAPEDLRHIFDKFYQGESGHRKEGNGLGLALVKRIADILSADIVVTSEKGRGSEFSLSLTL